MFKSLIDESINYEELTAQIELKEIELKEINPNSKRTNALTKLKNCEIKRLHFKLMDLKLTSKDRVREVKLWLQIMSDCIKDDPTINISNVDEHQLESYKQRFEKEVKIALESNNNSLFKSASMHLEGLK